MKLIDLLVQHLGSNGGWPIGAEICAQDIDGEVCFYANSYIRRGRSDHSWSIPELGENKVVKRRIFMKQAEDMAESIITREQYEAALAASKQVEWDGEGLPPVGCECEFFNEDYECRDSVPSNGTVVKIVAHQKSKSGIDCAVFTWHGESCAVHAEVCNEYLFRPIRTESERKRDESISKIQSHAHVDFVAPISTGQAVALYDAIAAGKIKGVKLDDL